MPQPPPGPIPATPHNYVRQDQVDVRFHVDGVRYGDTTSWVTATGGKKTAPGAKTRVGGMGAEVELGGPATRSNLVLTTQMCDAIEGQHGTLQSLIGVGRASAAISLLNMAGNPRAGTSVHTINGILLGAELPDFNGEATGAVGMYTVTIGCDEHES
jgi:hypothetical protein